MKTNIPSEDENKNLWRGFIISLVYILKLICLTHKPNCLVVIITSCYISYTKIKHIRATNTLHIYLLKNRHNKTILQSIHILQINYISSANQLYINKKQTIYS